MESVADQIAKIVIELKSEFENMTDEDWSYQIAPGKWSKKEILGHLIDSATNNHQRFVRLQFEENPLIIYDPDKWVKGQDYKNAEIELLINLWFFYNQHLAHIIKSIDEVYNLKKCNIKKEELVSLEWLVNDYLRHLIHHINQITIK